MNRSEVKRTNFHISMNIIPSFPYLPFLLSINEATNQIVLYSDFYIKYGRVAIPNSLTRCSKEKLPELHPRVNDGPSADVCPGVSTMAWGLCILFWCSVCLLLPAVFWFEG